MADNVIADAGSGGATFATDEDGGSIHHPYVKLEFGPGDTQTKVTASVGLPVELLASTAAIGKLAANDGVDIGDVDVTSLIPLTGATNLGKAIDNVVGATDTGVAMLAKHAAATARLATDEGDYDVPRLSEFGALLTEPEQHFIIDEMDALEANGGTWAAIDSDTTGVALSTKHVLGSGSIEFDKVNGGADSGIGGITKALTAINLSGLSPHDIFQTVVQVGATTELDGGTAYFFLRLGTNSTDYNEWRISGTDFTAGVWETVAMEVGDASFAGQGGAGCDFAAITYVAVGFSFDAVNDALPNIYVDEISFHTNQHVNAAINAEISSSISSANINVQKIAGSPTTKGAGNAGNGSQRIVIATDDINMAAIKAALEGALDVSGATITVAAHAVTNAGTFATQATLQTGSNAIGKLAANDGVDIGDVDVASLPGAVGTGGSKVFWNGDLNTDVEITDTAASTVFWIHCMNTTSGVIYLSIWDADSADIALGSDIATYQFPVPTQGDTNGAGFTINFGPHGIAHATGLSIGAATTTGGATDPNGVSVVVGYQD